jgi:hypothetical protein
MDDKEKWARASGYRGPMYLKDGSTSQKYFEWRARNGHCNCPQAFALAKKQERRLQLGISRMVTLKSGMIIELPTPQ